MAKDTFVRNKIHINSSWDSLIPTISTSSSLTTFPLSILPVTTVPLPEIEKTSSTGIKNSLSISLLGSGIKSSKPS